MDKFKRNNKFNPHAPGFRNIGRIVLYAVDQNIKNKTGNNYDLNDFINDFSGTQEELDITLIKMAAEVI